MQETLLNIPPIVGILITGLFSIISVVIMSLVQYKINIKNKKNTLQNKKLIQAYRDIISLRELEDIYASVLADSSADGSTTLAIKKRFRLAQRKLGKESPSNSSAILYCQQEIKKLSQ
jgi:hypothetical protein